MVLNVKHVKMHIGAVCPTNLHWWTSESYRESESRKRCSGCGCNCNKVTYFMASISVSKSVINVTTLVQKKNRSQLWWLPSWRFFCCELWCFSNGFEAESNDRCALWVACALDIMRMHPELMHGERFLDDRHIWCSENRVITGNFLISSQARADSKYCTVLYWMSNDEN